MKCEEAAEFLSALCDGERIPRVAAEHIGTCEACHAHLKEYTEIGAELRRVASLELTEEVRPRIWEQRQGIKSNWWAKGWETMRIPRFAFALLLVGVLVLGSSLVIVKVRAHTQGPVLMLTVRPASGHSVLCPLSTVEERSISCGSMVGLKSGIVADSFRFISQDGNRIQLGVRAQFTAVGPGSHTASVDDLERVPERQYWFKPGEKLEIEVAGLGTMVVTGEWKDHIPSIVTQNNELDPEQDELRMISPVLLRGQKVVFDFQGFGAIATGIRQGVFIYAPSEGRYVLSLSPLAGAVPGRNEQSRICFKINGQAYAFLTAVPVARNDVVWVLHQPGYRLSQESAGGLHDQRMTWTGDVSHLLAQTQEKN